MQASASTILATWLMRVFLYYCSDDCDVAESDHQMSMVVVMMMMRMMKMTPSSRAISCLLNRANFSPITWWKGWISGVTGLIETGAKQIVPGHYQEGGAAPCLNESSPKI